VTIDDRDLRLKTIGIEDNTYLVTLCEDNTYLVTLFV